MEGVRVNMPDLVEEVVDFESIRGQLVDGRKEFDVLGETLEGSTVKAEPLCGLELEDGEIEGDVEECIEKSSGRNLGDLGCLVEEQLGKVSLDGAAEKNLCVLQVVTSLNHEISGVEEAVTEDSSKSVEVGIGTCDGMKSDGDVVVLGDNENKVDESVDDGDGSKNESEDEDESSSDSSSSSSSSSSSEDDDDGENTGKNGEGSGDEETEMEDGEILLSDLEEMVSWSDVEDEDGGGAGGGPIKSKNELKVCDCVCKFGGFMLFKHLLYLYIMHEFPSNVCVLFIAIWCCNAAYL